MEEGATEVSATRETPSTPKARYSQIQRAGLELVSSISRVLDIFRSELLRYAARWCMAAGWSPQALFAWRRIRCKTPTQSTVFVNSKQSCRIRQVGTTRVSANQNLRCVLARPCASRVNDQGDRWFSALGQKLPVWAG